VLYRDDSAAKRMGRLIHCIALGGDYVVYDGERRGKAWEAFVAKHADADPKPDIVTAKEYEKAKRVAYAVQSHPLAAPLLLGEKEVRIEWEFLGRACSSRLDVIGHSAFISDLKTSSNTEPGWFVRHSLRLAYPARMAFYREAARYAGYRVDDVYVVSVEVDPPYAVTAFRLTERALDEGIKRCHLWMERLLVSEKTGEFPAYTQRLMDMDVSDDFELEGLEDEEVAA
jgi:hypothetical protein